MTTPTFAQWRNPNQANNSLPPQTIAERILWALVAYATFSNPDGTRLGS